MGDQVEGGHFTDQEKRDEGVLLIKKVKKREKYKNTNTSPLPGYYIENVTKIASNFTFIFSR